MTFGRVITQANRSKKTIDVTIEQIVNGASVYFGLGYFSLLVNGTFIGDYAKWNSMKHNLHVKAAASAKLCEAMRKMQVNFLLLRQFSVTAYNKNTKNRQRKKQKNKARKGENKQINNKMKKVLNYLMIAAVAALVCTACSKDNEDDTEGIDKSKNYVKYNGKDYTIVSAGLANYEDFYENGTYSYGIRFMLGGSNFVEVDVLFSNSTFPEGSKTYSYSTSHAAGTMDAFFYKIDDDSSESAGNLKSGSTIVSKNGKTYEISFNVTTPDGKTFLGHYKETAEE
ncbi:MAG: hypothetical protein LBL90_12850 [Prevotellaceae bacterium]|jgi:hypothetical protein|nr:hypothetical protein [Prevotellaceae bacterium]